MAGKARRTPKASAGGARTVAGWRGNALDLTLGAEDVGLLDNVMSVVPILRIVAAIGKEARRRRLEYPVSAAGELQSCLGKTTLRYGGHRVSSATIAHGMPDAWFPIHHEGELLSRVHLALLRCELETAQLAPRPSFHAG